MLVLEMVDQIALGSRDNKMLLLLKDELLLLEQGAQRLGQVSLLRWEHSEQITNSFRSGRTH